jgi:hypothetical protein
MTITIEAPVEPQAPEVAALSEETRQELIALREGGMTLAELKTRFPQLTSEQIREVLPPTNKREATQRKAKEARTDVTKGVGGRSGKKASEPKPKQDEAPKPAPAPRYAEGVDELAARVLAARQVVGRTALAEALGLTGSAVWRAEHGRIHPGEVEPLTAAMEKIDERIQAGEFVKSERQPQAKQPSKTDLLHRIEVAAELLHTAKGDKSVGKSALIDSLLIVLEPAAPTK